jgi:cysteine desulfuration protein SufE
MYFCEKKQNLGYNRCMMDIEKKISKVKDLFAGCSSADERMRHLLDLGRTLAPYPPDLKIPSLQVSGCQSILYLYSRLENGKLFFQASADALISAGLAALLIHVYSGETPETILRTPPSFLTDLGIFASLSPSRSNGLAHIHQRMKRDALKFLVSTTKNIEPNSAPH